LQLFLLIAFKAQTRQYIYLTTEIEKQAFSQKKTKRKPNHWGTSFAHKTNKRSSTLVLAA
jgi:hypothetical protein